MNLVVKTSHWTQRDIRVLYEDEPVTFVDDLDLSQLAVLIGAYKSTSAARRAGRFGPIPSGWTIWKASKKVHVFIWNPSE